MTKRNWKAILTGGCSTLHCSVSCEFSFTKAKKGVGQAGGVSEIVKPSGQLLARLLQAMEPPPGWLLLVPAPYLSPSQLLLSTPEPLRCLHPKAKICRIAIYSKNTFVVAELLEIDSFAIVLLLCLPPTSFNLLLLNN